MILVYEAGNDTAKYTHYFDKPIPLENDKYEIGLVGLDTYYSIPNITSGINANFRYSLDNQVTWNLITLPTGCYEVKTIADEISNTLTPAHSQDIVIQPDIATLRCRIRLSASAAIDFTYPNSINTVLGFKPQILAGGRYYYSDAIVNIQPINSINVNVDCISNSYINGKQSTSIFGFFPTVSPGFKITIDRQTPTFLPFMGSSLTSITMWLTDQNGALVNFRGENITARFYLRRK